MSDFRLKCAHVIKFLMTGLVLMLMVQGTTVILSLHDYRIALALALGHFSGKPIYDAISLKVDKHFEVITKDNNLQE